MIGKVFLTAGRAVFTASNPTGDHYTFRVSAPAKQDASRPIWFVSMLTGPDNTSDYTYLGLLTANGSVRHTGKSAWAADSKPFKVGSWAVAQLWNDRPAPAGYKIQHEGKCGRCGRALTCPESIESGIGPVCAEKGQE